MNLLAETDEFLQLHPAVQVTMIVCICALIGWFWHCMTRD